MNKETVTVAGTKYFKTRPSGPSRKQRLAEATNQALRMAHVLQVKQAKAREAKSGVVEHVPEPQYVGAPDPMTLVRAVAKKSKLYRKLASHIKREGIVA